MAQIKFAYKLFREYLDEKEKEHLSRLTEKHDGFMEDLWKEFDMLESTFNAAKQRLLSAYSQAGDNRSISQEAINNLISQVTLP